MKWQDLFLIIIKANIKESKKLFDESKREYELADQKAKAQEEALRQVNQKLADKAMEVLCNLLLFCNWDDNNNDVVVFHVWDDAKFL